MLILKRSAGQTIVIGDHIVVTIHSIESGRVTLDVVAPKEIRVLRGELLRSQPQRYSPPEPKEA